MEGFGKKTKDGKKQSNRKIISKSEKTLKEAMQHHKRRELKQAEKKYRTAIESGSQNIVAFIYLGVICQTSGRYEEAISLYEEATRIKPENPDAYINLGSLYKSLGEMKKAKTLTLKAIDLQSDNPIALMNLGGICKDLEEHDQALEATLKSLKIKPNNPNALLNLSGIYKELNRLDEALNTALRSIEIEPNNPESHLSLGAIYRQLNKTEKALSSTLRAIELKPDNPYALMNLGGIYQEAGKLDEALTSTLQSLKLKPDNPYALMNLGGIYQEAGNLDQALISTLQSLKLKSDNTEALVNLGGIYKDLGRLEQALIETNKALKLQPEDSMALCKSGQIKMALGLTKEAKKDLRLATKKNTQECEAYFTQSLILETTEEAEELINSIKQVNCDLLSPTKMQFIKFAQSNCFHKTEDYRSAANYLKEANHYKMMAFPCNSKKIIDEIRYYLSCPNQLKIDCGDERSGANRIFIVGMPRCGSTLLETILSMNPYVKDLGESRSLGQSILKMEEKLKKKDKTQGLHEIYSQMEPMEKAVYTYSTDKNLYNFIYTDWIARHMPGAKIIHCRRHPMDNILSIHRSNLSAGNNYSANLEKTAEVLISEEEAMAIHKNNHPNKIYTFDYDKFVNSPKENLKKLLDWLGVEFEEYYLHPEQSTRTVNTASVMQARKPISNKSVGGWLKYEQLLMPAQNIISKSKIQID